MCSIARPINGSIKRVFTPDETIVFKLHDSAENVAKCKLTLPMVEIIVNILGLRCRAWSVQGSNCYSWRSPTCECRDESDNHRG